MTTTNSRQGPRRLDVRWMEHSWEAGIRRAPAWSFSPLRSGGARGLWPGRRLRGSRFQGGNPPPCGFTLLEMLIVVTIIALLAKMALPSLTGMTRGSTITIANQQMSAAVSLARQMAVSTRSPVYLVFDSPSAFAGNPAEPALAAYRNLQTHEYTAYAIVSLRSVGDQPGRPNPQYLTDWKTLPQGVFIPTYMFAGSGLNTMYTTNTLAAAANQVHEFQFLPFSLTPLPGVPFPTANSAPTVMPCIAFSPNGQLMANVDQYIPLARGAVRYFPDGSVVATEVPTGNSVNDCNLVHIDYLTGRPKLERNQF